MSGGPSVIEWPQIRRQEQSLWSLGLQCCVRVRLPCVFSLGDSIGVLGIMDGCPSVQECGDLRFCWFHPYLTGNHPPETQTWLIERGTPFSIPIGTLLESSLNECTVPSSSSEAGLLTYLLSQCQAVRLASLHKCTLN